MDAFWIALDPLDRVFFVSAMLGLVMLLARSVIGLFGGDVDLDSEIDLGGDSDFQIFSLQTLTAFFLIFGLAGLALHRGSRLGEGLSVIGAFLIASAVVVLLAKILQAMKRLDASGNLDLKSTAVGCQGTVYLTVSKGGGKVQIEIANRLLTLDATCDSGTIKTGERVEVTDVINGGMLLVKRA